MFCNLCGSALRENAQFCQICGAKIGNNSGNASVMPLINMKVDEQICSKCNSVFSKYNHICPHCGQKVLAKNISPSKGETEKKWMCESCGCLNISTSNTCSCCYAQKPKEDLLSSTYNCFYFSTIEKVWFWIQLILAILGGIGATLGSLVNMYRGGSFVHILFVAGLFFIALGVQYGNLMKNRSKKSACLLIAFYVVSNILVCIAFSLAAETVPTISDIYGEIIFPTLINAVIHGIILAKEWKNLK